MTYDSSDETTTFDHEDEPDAHRDTLLGRQFPGLSIEAADSVRREMARREAAGLPAVPEMSWDD
ncbi:hypothetical protein [Streptomyces sp. EKS3.2]|uniref:hypothetical protein n=1 Tax=Streptomyces sp. EKS3.2 TaxID=3461008 RepID=UPI00404367FA